MFHDAEQLKKLSQPKQLQEFSFTNLSWLLRHKEHWPDNFQWYYNHYSHCAHGLAYLVWNVDIFNEKYYELNAKTKTRIFRFGNFNFLFGISLPAFSSSPDRIANLIDKALCK